MQSYHDLLNRLFTNPQALEEEIAKAVTVDDDNIYGELANQPGLLAKWGVLVALAKGELADLSRSANSVVWNTVKSKQRNLLKDQKEKVTEKRVEELAYQDEGYLQAANTLARYNVFVSVLEKVESAVWQKMQSLQSMNSRQKRELEGYPGDMDHLRSVARQRISDSRKS